MAMLNFLRIDQFQWLLAVFPVDGKVGIEGKNNVFFVDLGHSYETGIG
ncbi:MAG: hypothetical protein NTX36_15375 [Proteobacteria bacterium]|nr:hypothetical protein [Pseudomonadota bacterium]